MQCERDYPGLDGVQLVRLESDWLSVDVAPNVGGRVVSLIEKSSGHEFLWRNAGLRLELLKPGSQYDPNFYGGIDELLPNDIPEEINGINCPDHGELWTMALNWSCENEILKLEGILPRFGLRYERTMSLRKESPILDVDYRISNPAPYARQFLWTLHAALAVERGDVIDCPARRAQVGDLNCSRFSSLEFFVWPTLEGKTANVVPPADGTMDFFYLFDLAEGRIAWRRPNAGLEFRYEFDTRVFPYVWIFASYGRWQGHYMVILEPSTAMPNSVNDAAKRGQCSVLQPGESLETRVSIRVRNAA